MFHIHIHTQLYLIDYNHQLWGSTLPLYDETRGGEGEEGTAVFDVLSVASTGYRSADHSYFQVSSSFSFTHARTHSSDFSSIISGSTNRFQIRLCPLKLELDTCCQAHACLMSGESSGECWNRQWSDQISPEVRLAFVFHKFNEAFTAWHKRPQRQ